MILATWGIVSSYCGLSISTHQKIRRIKNQPSPLKALNPPENPDTQKNLDDLTQMRATLAERLGVSENEIEMMALKYLLHATESRAL